MKIRCLAALLLLPTAACDAVAGDGARQAPVAASAPVFPAPDRPVAAIVSDEWSDEGSRDDVREADRVMALLEVGAGQTVADIGAGKGYYTVRLAPRVGGSGRVFAQDIVPDYLARLGERVRRAGLRNVTLVEGRPDDPRLPANALDLALMVHMYHEIAQPFSLLWHLHASLKPGALVAIVDMDRPTGSHGTPPALLRCELAAVGFSPAGFHDLGAGDGYLAVFRATAPRPAPAAIRPCAAPR